MAKMLQTPPVLSSLALLGYGNISISHWILFLLGICASLRILHIVRIYLNRPTSIFLCSQPYDLGKWLKNFEFILHGPAIILQAYRDRGSAESFAITSLSEYQVLVCSKQDVEALCNATEDVLSFHSAMTDRMKHKYTMFGFEYGNIDPHDSIPSRVIKVLLRTHLPVLRSAIEDKIKSGFDLQMAQGQKCEDWTAVSTFKFSKAVIEQANALVILGEDLAKRSECVEAAIQYTEDAVIAAEICRQLPGIFTPLIAPVMMSWTGSMNKLAAFIAPVLRARMCSERMGSTKAQTCNDCGLTAQIIGILLAASHQLSMSLVYVIYNLCNHPEHTEVLRKEIRDVLRQELGDPFKEMHLLDAFLLETARLNPPDALTVQRKVLRTFKLPSGGSIPPGNLVAVPQQAISLNPDAFPDPARFDPTRFLPKNWEKRETEAVTRLTDVSYAFTYWGSPRKACPGRWYVAHILKQSVVHLLMNYDFKLEHPQDKKFFAWTTAVVPRLSTKILLRPYDYLSDKV